MTGLADPRRLGRTVYLMDVHVDRGRWRPWWAVMAYSVALPGGGVLRATASGRVRACSRKLLIAKCKHWIARDMRRNGYVGEAHVTVREGAASRFSTLPDDIRQRLNQWVVAD